MRTVISIPGSEWEEALELVDLIDPDESPELGQVRLRCVQQRRRWTTTDRCFAAALEGGPDTVDLDVGLPPALIEFAVVASRFSGEAQLVMHSEGEHRRLGTRRPSLATPHAS